MTQSQSSICNFSACLVLLALPGPFASPAGAHGEKDGAGSSSIDPQRLAVQSKKRVEPRTSLPRQEVSLLLKTLSEARGAIEAHLDHRSLIRLAGCSRAAFDQIFGLTPEK